jgi:carbon monoxide dehydrogenase subunit G
MPRCIPNFAGVRDLQSNRRSFNACALFESDCGALVQYFVECEEVYILTKIGAEREQQIFVELLVLVYRSE